MASVQAKARDAVADWYQKAVGLCLKLQQAGHRVTSFKSELDVDAMGDNLNPVLDEMQDHVGDAPSGVQQAALVELVALAAMATGIINMAEEGESTSLEVFFETLRRDSDELLADNFEIDDFDELFEVIDVDEMAKQFVEEVEPESVDLEAMHRLGESFSPEMRKKGRPTSIEEAVNLPLELVPQAVGDEQLREYVP